MVKFGDAERNILALLGINNTFILNKVKYTIVDSGKPTCKKGEPKTDIYVLAKDEDGNQKELKISFKKENADFIENKINEERAEQLLGSNWQAIIKKATTSISNVFENKKLIYKIKGGRTEEGAITLGWKYELLNKTGGELSGVVELSKEQIIDVYAGTHLSDDKKDAMVNGRVIRDCGIANFMLMNDNLSTTQDIIDNLCLIEDYVNTHPTVYFACKALNYRTYYDKYDGNRPLAVYVDWKITDGKLDPVLKYDNPLIIKGTEVANRLKGSLKMLNIKTTKDIDESLVVTPSVILK